MAFPVVRAYYDDSADFWTFGEWDKKIEIGRQSLFACDYSLNPGFRLRNDCWERDDRSFLHMILQRFRQYPDIVQTGGVVPFLVDEEWVYCQRYDHDNHQFWCFVRLYRAGESMSDVLTVYDNVVAWKGRRVDTGDSGICQYPPSVVLAWARSILGEPGVPV